MWIFLLLIFIFFIWPLIKVTIAVNRVKKNARQAFESMHGQQQRQQQERKAGWSSSKATKKKKIERGIGDYVAYEEIPSPPDQDPSAGHHDCAVREQQIIDAEWEDIP